MVTTAAADTAAVPNAGRLLWGGFAAILAAGVGFGVRGGILDNWGAEFGFTAAELGAIGGAGFSGFCFGILVGGLICDRIGYGKLVVLAFVLHVLSAVVTLSADGAGAYANLYWGMFLFAYANGTLEAVANPLVATLFPESRTHHLNLLHASWPAGLVIGGALGWILDDRFQLDWRIQIAAFLIPTLIYGLVFLGQQMPRSEASQKGLKLGEMLKDVGILGTLVVGYLLALFIENALGAPVPVAYGFAAALVVIVGLATRFAVGSVLLFVLFVAHALIGAVELGTDAWIQNITGNILTSEQGKILFVATSATMFVLRFSAALIERRLGLSPVAILLACSIFACVGLNMASTIVTFTGALLALLIYAVGKTFLWPTMLAIAADRFPRSGAIAISLMGGIGMMSAGLIGSPGLGYAKDRFAAEAVRAADPVIYEAYRAESPSRFLFFEPVHGLDGKKLTAARARAHEASDARLVLDASIAADRKTLRADAFVPLALALIFAGMLWYFRSIGGYKKADI